MMFSENRLPLFRIMLCKTINLPRIAEIKRLAVGVADTGRQHPRRIVIIPVRIVGREQQFVPADPVDHLEQMTPPQGTLIGCVVQKMWSRIVSDGGRVTCGTSPRS